MKHVYHDSLWAYSGRKVPNDGFLADQVVASEGAPPAAAAAAAADESDEEEAEEEEAEEEEAEAEEEPMAPDELMNYCFYAALKTTCTDAELPLSADKFYSHHMQPARPAKQPPLDAKKSSFKQIGKFIKAMHKAKAIAVREVKNVITILSVDRAAKERHHPPHPPSKTLLFSCGGQDTGRPAGRQTGKETHDFAPLELGIQQRSAAQSNPGCGLANSGGSMAVVWPTDTG